MTALGLVVGLALSAAPWPVEPEVGVAFALQPRALSVTGEVSGTSQRSPAAVPALTVGLRVPVWDRRVWLHSTALVGVETLGLHPVLGLQQQALYGLALTPWLSVGAGLGVTLSLDTATPAFSAAAFGAVLGVQLWRFQLLWTPALQVPLGAQSTEVTGARVQQGMALAVTPVAFVLRFWFGPPGVP